MERGLVDIPQDHSIQYNTRSSGKHSVNIWNQLLLHHNEWNSLPSTILSCKSLM